MQATQPTMGNQPTYLPGIINGLGAIRFDGTDDFVSFPTMSDIRTVFLALNRTVNNDAFLLGDLATFDFHSANGRVWSIANAHPDLYNGILRVNGNQRDGLITDFSTGEVSVVAVRPNGPVQASNFTNDRNIANRYWNGELAELLIYSESLSDEDMIRIEAYLSHKWGAQNRLPGAHAFKNSSTHERKSCSQRKSLLGS